MAKRPRSGEFELIARYFEPLTANQPGALGLSDDAALLPATAGNVHVLTADTLVGGVHFLADDPPDLIARKLLRVNLSDLAAMAAKPVGYLLALSLPADHDDNWIEAFTDGLASDQTEFDIGLLGGDTTSTPGPLSATITAIGEVPAGAELRRSGARIGDIVCVSGTIGDSALGLMAIAGELPGMDPSAANVLIDRYRLPRPRVTLGMALRDIASAAADVSDGLLADLGHICETSGVGARINQTAIPLSDAARSAIAAVPDSKTAILSGGDDYELVFTAPQEAAPEILEAANRAGVPVTEIGRIVDGKAVAVFGPDGREIEVARAGYRHF